MGLGAIGAEEVAKRSLGTLGLADASAEVLSREGLAASVRRAASLLCPTTPGRLTRSVNEVLSMLPGFTPELSLTVADIVSLLVAYGDLIELPVDLDGRTQRHLFLGQPSYVQLDPSTSLLVGIRPEGLPLVTEELLPNIEYRGHARFIRGSVDHPIRDLLDLEGLMSLPPQQWIKAPRASKPDELISLYTQRLDAATSSGEIEGLRVIDPASRVTFYSGRWRPLKSNETAHFVARRSQAYGADLWCYLSAVEGKPNRLIDLPILSPLSSGADEALRLQAAIDASRGAPQRVGTHDHGEAVVVDFYSPVPSWAQRRLDVVGTAVEHSRGALFSYSISTSHIAAELAHLRETMWISADEEGRELHDGLYEQNDGKR